MNSFNSIVMNFSNTFIKDIGLANTSSAAIASLYNRIQNQAFVLSFLQLVGIMMVIFSISFIPILFIKLKKKVQNVSDSH